jgi:hypothetical protein
VKNKIEDLRNHLFETLEALKDKEHPMDIERAKAIAQVADVLVETAKVEVQFIEAVGGKGSGFIPDKETTLPAPAGLRKIEGGKP